MTQYPEDLHDELEAYPLRLNVAALPDRRFFKMTRTLTVCVVLLSALLILLGVFLNYQITHLDVSVRRKGVWQFYHIDPIEKRLKPMESSSIRLDPMRLVVEERLRKYLEERNSTVWDQEEMSRRLSGLGVVAQISHPDVFTAFGPDAKAMLAQTRGAGLVRDVHIYELKLMSELKLSDGKVRVWMAIIETFDLPMANDWGGAVCACSDNSKTCLDCKIQKSKHRERFKVWIRTFDEKKRALCEANKNRCPDNPLGIMVDKYIPLMMPIHEDNKFWDVPLQLRPKI